MSESGAVEEVISALNSAGFDIDNSATSGQGRAYITAIVTAIIAHIKANATATDTGGAPPNDWPIK